VAHSARIARTITAALLAASAWHAHALQVTSFTPQGEVAKVRQVVVKFDEPAAPFGDPKAPAPVR
jgi:hypothetical protein